MSVFLRVYYIYVYNACHIFVVFISIFDIINIQFARIEFILLYRLYIDDSYHLENDIYYDGC